MPRRSANERMTEGVAVPWGHERPDPPDGMPEAQAAIWRAVVASMRPKWFTAENHELLRRYCFAMVESARLEHELSATDPWSDSYNQLQRWRNNVAKSALDYAKALRITPISNRENLNKIDGRDSARSLHPKPWELDDDKPRRKLWKDPPNDD